ncbi:MAG: hypothetical protein ACFCGT_20200 [Sandaracinaceae bacterium]
MLDVPDEGAEGPVGLPPPRPEPPIDRRCVVPSDVDFDGDGVALPCDDLLELPEAFLADDGELDPPRIGLAARGEQAAVWAGCVPIALPPADVTCRLAPPLVVEGDAHARLYPEVAQAGDGRQADLRATVTDAQGTWMNRQDRFGESPSAFQVRDGRVAASYSHVVDVHPAVDGSALVSALPPDGGFLDRHRGADVDRLAEGRTSFRIETHGEVTHVSGRAPDGSEERTALAADGTLTPLLASLPTSGIGLLRVGATSDTGWYCVTDRRGVRVQAVRGATVVEGLDVRLPEPGDCRSVRTRALGEVLWIGASGPGGTGNLYRLEEGERELVLPGAPGDPRVYPAADGVYVLGSFTSGVQPAAVHRYRDGRLSEPLLVADVPPAVRARGGRLGLNWRFPRPPGSDASPVAIHVAQVDGDVVRETTLPGLGPVWPHVDQSWLGPDGSLWLHARPAGPSPGPARLLRVTDGRAQRVLSLGISTRLTFVGEVGLLGVDGPEAGLYRIVGTELEPLASATGPHAVLFTPLAPFWAQPPPEPFLDGDGGLWVAYPTPSGHAVATFLDGVLTPELGALSEMPAWTLDADGVPWLLWRDADGAHAARLIGSDLERIHEGYDQVLAQADVDGAAWGVRLLRGGEQHLCPYRAVDGPCHRVPMPEPTFVQAPVVTAGGRAFAVLEDADGRRFLWRTLALP